MRAAGQLKQIIVSDSATKGSDARDSYVIDTAVLKSAPQFSINVPGLESEIHTSKGAAM